MSKKSERRTPQLRNTQSKPSDEEINIYINVNKTIAMKVKKSETFKNLKTMLCEKEGILEDLQQLTYDGGKFASDDWSIMDYGICNNSTVCVREISRIKLCFKMPSKKKTFELEVKSTDSFTCIKFTIQSKQGIHPNEYTIYYAGEPVTDFRTVASLNIQRGATQATLYMICNPTDKLSISVETPTKHIIKLQARCTHTVYDVKKIVECMTNLPGEEWDLFNGRKRLENEKTLAYYDIKERDTLKMWSAMYKIFVKTRTGETVTLETTQLDTISDVKEKLFEKTDVPVSHQELMFAGRILEDNKNLAFYNIEEEFTLRELIK